MKKIIVLAHHDPVAGSCVIPDFEVRGFVHAQVEDMAGSVSVRFQNSAKGFRELVVNQKIHALVSTT